MIARVFHRALKLDRWTRARFTPLGRTLMAALVAVGLFALNPRATLAWQLAILLLAVLVASMLWAPLFRPRFRAVRRLPRYATVGTPLRYAVEIQNRGRRTLTGVEAEDEAHRVPPAQAMAHARAALTPGTWWRRVGYVAYVRAVRELEGVRTGAAPVPPLPPGDRVAVSLELTPARRGYVQLERIRLTRSDPLGVFRALSRTAVADRLLVLPRRHAVTWSGAGATMRRPRRGSSRSQATGAGADFARLREYRPRDPLRHIHWRAWARLGEPVVKEFHEESPSRNALVLDTYARPGHGRAAFEEAVCVAASFVADAGWRSGRLDLLFAGETTVHLAQGSEGEGVGRMLEALACVAPGADDAGAGFPALARAVCALIAPERASILMTPSGWVMVTVYRSNRLVSAGP